MTSQSLVQALQHRAVLIVKFHMLLPGPDSGLNVSEWHLTHQHQRGALLATHLQDAQQ
ncbi:hypothetical protein ACIP5U_39185 [Streptomyces sp. NPDC088788]|uniref:hypothetical protein n=1 Tax=Streptomyces sp. NPDC088788 TaxID=3365898 RepID=UPI003804E7F4